MKKFILTIILSLTVIPSAFAASGSFKTYTPLNPTPPHFNHYNNGYLPPPPPPNHNYTNGKYTVDNKVKNKWLPRRRYLNNGYYTYNSPYYNYYPQRQSIFSSIGNFFSSGKMTGYTPSNSSSFDSIPYGYQNSIQSPDGDYFLNNYGFKSGASVKILD